MVDLRLDSQKCEKLEFSKSFVTFFIFFPRIFEKSQKEIQNFRVGYQPEKMKIVKNFFYNRNQLKVLIMAIFCWGIFNSWIISYVACSVFEPSAILELVIFNFVTYRFISNQNFDRLQTWSQNFWKIRTFRIF